MSGPGRVTLVGAGPGDPELLTLRAVARLGEADVVFYDALVDRAALQYAPRARWAFVGKRAGRPSVSQATIQTLMIRRALRDERVVRLKSGDPLIFGRAAEEITALNEAGVPFEIVAGITSAFAAAAAIPCSLTDRNSASSVTFSTGHHAASHNDSQLPQMEDTTRVVYMPGRDLRILAAEWLAEGLPAEFPCAVVSRAAQADQEVFQTTLGELGNAAPAAAPSILLAGWAIRDAAVAAARVREAIAATA